MPVRIEQMEIPFAPRSILRLFGLESQIVEASPERVHIRHMEDQPTPAVDRLTMLQIENLKEIGHEGRVVMTEQNRSSFAVVTFYTTSALVTALGLAILITGATIAYMVAGSA